jgi:hypothetical protein
MAGFRAQRMNVFIECKVVFGQEVIRYEQNIVITIAQCRHF